MKRWSTKDLTVLREPRDGRPGDGIFTFTDRYSVYDFGEMPDPIPGKGRASVAMAMRSFALLEAAGVATHKVEQVADDAIRVRLLTVHTHGTQPVGAAEMIPLQVVYRAALPRESSVHRRLAAGRLDPEEIPAPKAPGSPWLDRVMVEFTTKFEQTDRFVDRAEAARVGRVTPARLDEVADLTVIVHDALRAHSERVGLQLVDGKAEYGLDSDGALLLIDHAGTPDENRFYHRGFPVCKELLRALHPDVRETVQAGVRDGVPRSRWPRPQPLPAALVEATAEVYAAVAALWTGGTPQADVRLAAAVDAFRALAGARALLDERTGLAAGQVAGERIDR